MSARLRTQFSFLLGAFGVSAAAFAGQTEIRVTLFGQQCALQGPLEAKLLQSVHEISPEQASPSISMDDPALAARELSKALEKLRDRKTVPTALDRYRERLIRRIEAQIAFAEGIQSAKKPAALLAATRKHLLKSGSSARKAQIKAYEERAQKLSASNGSSPGSSDELYESYLELIEPDPEEEFHRAIRRLNIRYVCSFEDESSEEEAAEESAE